MSLNENNKINNPFMALKHRDFAIYWASMCISLIGTWMQFIALPWIAYTLTDSAFLLGLSGAMQFAPMLLFSLFAGVIIDKFNKKKIIIFTQIASLIVTLILAILVWKGHVEFWHILVLSATLGLVNTFDMPARQSLIIELVGKEDLMNAIALNSSAFNAARIVGPALAGLTIAYLGPSFCFFFNSISFAVVIVALFLIKPKVIEKKLKKDLGMLKEIGNGLKYIYQKKILFKTILSVAILSTFAVNFGVLIPVFTKEILGMGEATFGLLTSFSGIGSLLGAVGVASFSKSGPSRFVINFSPVLIGILLILLGLGSSFAITAALMAASGLFFVSYNSTTNSTVQLNTEDEYRGRVMSVYSLVFGGFTPFGSLFSGAITEKFGPRVGLAACGISIIILFAILNLFMSHKKK